MTVLYLSRFPLNSIVSELLQLTLDISLHSVRLESKKTILHYVENAQLTIDDKVSN